MGSNFFPHHDPHNIHFADEEANLGTLNDEREDRQPGSKPNMTPKLLSFFITLYYLLQQI